jgi:hypothetical protein
LKKLVTPIFDTNASFIKSLPDPDLPKKHAKQKPFKSANLPYISASTQILQNTAKRQFDRAKSLGNKENAEKSWHSKSASAQIVVHRPRTRAFNFPTETDFSESFLLRNENEEGEEKSVDLHSKMLRKAFKQFGIIQASRALNIERGLAEETPVPSLSQQQELITDKLSESLLELSEKLECSANGEQLMEHVISSGQPKSNNLSVFSQYETNDAASQTIEELENTLLKLISEREKKEALQKENTGAENKISISQMCTEDLENELFKCYSQREKNEVSENFIKTNTLNKPTTSSKRYCDKENDKLAANLPSTQLRKTFSDDTGVDWDAALEVMFE